MTLADRLAAQSRRDLSSHAGSVVKICSDSLFSALAEWPEGSPYNRIPVAVRSAYDSIIATHGTDTATVTMRLAIFKSMGRQRSLLEQGPWRDTLPYFDEAALKICAAAEEGLYNPGLQRDEDLKDIALASGRLKACGAFAVEPQSGIERSRLIRSGLKSLLMGALYVTRAGGHAPYFESHLYARLLDHFTSEDRWRSYELLTRAMKQLPAIKGFTAVSWYFDPALVHVSPRLAYLQETLVANGAWLVPVKTSASAVQSALGRSPTRRRLYAEGKYSPQEYLVIWPRRAMIAAFE